MAALPSPLPPWAVAPLGCGTMALAFAVAYALSDAVEPAGERVAWPAIYPSAAINYPPAGNVGGALICLAAVLLSHAFLIRHAENAARLGAHRAWLNAASTVLGLLGLVVGPVCVANTPWHLYPGTHFAFAYATFYLGAAYLIAETCLDAARPEGRPAVPPWLRRARLALVAVGFVAMSSYIVCFGAVGRNHAHSPVPAADFTAAEACVELLCMTLLLLFVASFGLSQPRLRLEVRAVLEEGDDVGDARGPRAGGPTAATPLLGKAGAPAGYDAAA
jgi:hypothetical protein